MDYKEHIEYALDYIETNLKSELSLTDLAKAAGYSEYHFLRVFKQVVHLTPADYIRKRRLSEIAREIDDNNRTVSDIAFEYGFNSKENFTRAFKAEHNVLPTEYKSSGNSLKLFDRFRLDITPFKVMPKIVTLTNFSLTGFYDSDKDDYNPPKFWNMYNCKKLSTQLSGGKIIEDYGVCRWNNTKKRLEYFIGIKTNDASENIENTHQLEISGGLYAVFATPKTSHFDFVNTIHRTWNYILSVWLPQSEYKTVCKPQFETYTEVSRTYSENIYIPIEPK